MDMGTHNMETKLIVDAATGEQVEKKLTAAEIQERKERESIAIEEAAAFKAKADARESALQKLIAIGLTDEEVQSLVSNV